MYNDSDISAIAEATGKVQDAMKEDPKIGCFVNFHNGMVVVGLLYADVPSEPPPAFEEFSKLPSLLTSVVPTTNGTILSLAKAMAHPDGSLR